MLKLVALMLLLPMDTSECERIFSLMNDLKSAERSQLTPRVLKNLMIWHYYGKKIAVSELPAYEILREWYKVCEEADLRNVQTARPASTLHQATLGLARSSGDAGQESLGSSA